MTIQSGKLASRLIKLQAGKETTWGTLVPATSVLMGINALPTLTPALKVTQIDQQLGTLVPAQMAASLAKGGAWEMAGTCTYEDILYLLGMAYGLPAPTGNTTKTISANTNVAATVITTTAAHGLVTGDTVTITGSNSTPLIDGTFVITKTATDKFTIPVTVTVAGTAGTVTIHSKWAFVPPSTQAWNPVSLSLEEGNTAGQDATLSGCLMQTWSLAGVMQQALNFTMKGFGKTFVAGTTLTGALNYRTVEPILFGQATFALDPAATAPGTTPLSASIVSWNVDGDTGIQPIYSGGSLEPTDFTFQKQATKVKLGLLYSSTLDTFLKANWVAGLPVMTRMAFLSGVKQFVFDFAGDLTTDPVLWGDNQGAQVIEVELDARADTQFTGNVAAAMVTNAVTTLP